MRTSSSRSRMVVLGCCVAVWSVLAACAVEDENPATTRNRGTDAGGDGAPGTGADGSAATGAPLCGKYGGLEGVRGIATEIVNAAKNDCRIGPAVDRAAQDRGANFKDCFEQFVASGFQCEGVSFTLGQTKDTEDRPCNSQMPGIRFTELDFNTFSQNVKTVLEAKGLSEDEVREIAPVFEGARAKLVNNGSRTKHAQCAANCTTGGEACVQPIIDAGNDAEPPPDAGSDAGE
ncbi:MAG: hypothetical protein KF795_16625 [Labilithrix sp.]|nr:hypothetical protein [Labilithrix sp.]